MYPSIDWKFLNKQTYFMLLLNILKNDTINLRQMFYLKRFILKSRITVFRSMRHAINSKIKLWRNHLKYNNKYIIFSPSQKSTTVDIESGIDQNKRGCEQLIQQNTKNNSFLSKAQTKPRYWNNDHSKDSNDNNGILKSKKNEKIKSVVCRVAIVSVVICLSVGVVLIWCFMGWLYGIQAVAVAIIAILITSGKWRWFYIAAITAPRDIR